MLFSCPFSFCYFIHLLVGSKQKKKEKKRKKKENRKRKSGKEKQEIEGFQV